MNMSLKLCSSVISDMIDSNFSLSLSLSLPSASRQTLPLDRVKMTWNTRKSLASDDAPESFVLFLCFVFSRPPESETRWDCGGFKIESCHTRAREHPSRLPLLTPYTLALDSTFAWQDRCVGVFKCVMEISVHFWLASFFVCFSSKKLFSWLEKTQ